MGDVPSASVHFGNSFDKPEDSNCPDCVWPLTGKHASDKGDPNCLLTCSLCAEYISFKGCQTHLVKKETQQCKLKILKGWIDVDTPTSLNAFLVSLKVLRFAPQFLIASQKMCC